MTDADVAAVISELLCAVKQKAGFKAAWLTHSLIDHIATSGAPALRRLVDAAVEARLGTAV